MNCKFGLLLDYFQMVLNNKRNTIYALSFVLVVLLLFFFYCSFKKIKKNYFYHKKRIAFFWKFLKELQIHQ